MGYVSIAAKLKELLDEIGDFGAVYDHDPDELNRYPAATIVTLGHKDRFHDTAANIRSFSFLIRLFYRTKDDEDAEAVLRDLADQVIEKLEANVVVPGVWDIAQPTESTWRHTEREMPVLVAEITATIECRVLR